MSDCKQCGRALAGEFLSAVFFAFQVVERWNFPFFRLIWNGDGTKVLSLLSGERHTGITAVNDDVLLRYFEYLEFFILNLRFMHIFSVQRFKKMQPVYGKVFGYRVWNTWKKHFFIFSKSMSHRWKCVSGDIYEVQCDQRIITDNWAVLSVKVFRCP